MGEAIFNEEVKVLSGEEGSGDLVVKAPLSPVLARLIEEVRIDQAEGPHAYNRMHNRHNRSR